jgi:hypothetical protein
MDTIKKFIARIFYKKYSKSLLDSDCNFNTDISQDQLIEWIETSHILLNLQRELQSKEPFMRFKIYSDKLCIFEDILGTQRYEIYIGDVNYKNPVDIIVTLFKELRRVLDHNLYLN